MSLTSIVRPCALPATLLVLAFTCGCQPAADGTRTYTDKDNVENEAPHHEHMHGPHEGHLVELGGEDYHAEVVFGTDRKLEVYLLASDAKTPLPTDAESISLRLDVAGTPQEFKLSPAAGETAGKAAHFELTDGTVPESIKDAEDLKGEVVVSISGTSYRGPITHDHEHDEHGHGAGEHAESKAAP